MRNKQIFLTSGKIMLPGKASGPALLSSHTLSFSRLEAKSGRITDRRVDIFGQSIQGKVLVFPYHRGSTTSPAVFLETCRLKAGPSAILVLKSDPLLIFSGLLAKKFYGVTIPIIEKIDKRMFKKLEKDVILKVDGYQGRIFLIS